MKNSLAFLLNCRALHHPASCPHPVGGICGNAHCCAGACAVAVLLLLSLQSLVHAPLLPAVAAGSIPFLSWHLTGARMSSRKLLDTTTEKKLPLLFRP